MAKRIMSYYGRAIWQNSAGYYTVAKGDGTDEIFDTIEKAFKYIEKGIEEKEKAAFGRFEVGKVYYHDGFTIKVIKRTEKTITVTNGNATWRMLVRRDSAGEFVIDSSARNQKYRLAWTFRA